jgi:hypothetical protein
VRDPVVRRSGGVRDPASSEFSHGGGRGGSLGTRPRHCPPYILDEARGERLFDSSHVLA